MPIVESSKGRSQRMSQNHTERSLEPISAILSIEASLRLVATGAVRLKGRLPCVVQWHSMSTTFSIIYSLYLTYYHSNCIILLL